MFLSLFLLFITFPSIFTYSLNWKSILVGSTDQYPGVSSQCSTDTHTFIKSLELASEVSIECIIEKKCTESEEKVLKENMYALEQYDAFGKLPTTGLFDIPLLFDGSYQECQRVSGTKYDTNYCYLLLLPGKNNSCHPSGGGNSLLPDATLFRSAVCMPISCDTTDLVLLYNQLSDLPFTACGAACSINEVEKDTAFWIFTGFMIVMISIAILATSVDYIRENVYQLTSDKEKNIFLKLLLAFSFWTNAGLLLSVAPQKPGFIKSLDCIRFLSMAWVVTGHTFTYLVPPDVLIPISNFPQKFGNHLILNAFFSVDTFFLLSGIVVAYLFFKEKPKRQMIMNPITWILFYVHRYLRLTPPLMIFIGFFTVYGAYVQGPFAAIGFNELIPEADACRASWWRNLLYINNFGDDNKPCYSTAWYLAVDTQLYLISPIILIGFYFSFAIGTFLVVAGCAASAITTYILYYSYDFPADFFGPGNTEYFHKVIYDKPWIRCPPYLIGLLVGYILATFGKRQVRLNWALQTIGWALCFGIALVCLFATYDYDKGSEWSIFTRATYYNFSRIFWAIAVSWVVVANHMGWGGPINNFMSHPIWQPFGRLSYCAYIVHIFILFCILNLGNKAIHYYSTWQIIICYAVPATLASYIFAFFWSCLFEVSTLKLEKMLIEVLVGKGGPKKEDGRTLWDEEGAKPKL